MTGELPGAEPLHDRHAPLPSVPLMPPAAMTGQSLYGRFMSLCGTLAALVIGACVVMVCYDVVARNLGLRSLTWVVEVTEYALPLATFLAAPWLLYRQEHVRLDLLQQVCRPATLRRIERLAAFIALTVSLVVCRYAVAAIQDARAIGALVMKTLVFPEWWLFVPLLGCFVLLAVESARRLFAPFKPEEAD